MGKVKMFLITHIANSFLITVLKARHSQRCGSLQASLMSSVIFPQFCGKNVNIAVLKISTGLRLHTSILFGVLASQGSKAVRSLTC